MRSGFTALKNYKLLRCYVMTTPDVYLMDNRNTVFTPEQQYKGLCRCIENVLLLIHSPTH